MASSTTKPSASVSASRLTLSSEKLSIAMPAKVPMIDSGRAMAGMKRGAPGAQERQDHQDDEDRRHHQRELHVVHRVADRLRPVAQDAELDGRRQQPVELRQHPVHGVGDGDRVGVRLALNGDDDGAHAVELGPRLVVLDRVVDLGDVLQPHRRAVAPGHHRRLEIGRVGLGALDLAGCRAAAAVRMLPIGADRGQRGHGQPDLLHRDAARRQRVEIVLDAHGPLLGALDVDLGDARQRRQLRAHHLVGELVDLLRLRRVGGERQEDDRASRPD